MRFSTMFAAAALAALSVGCATGDEEPAYVVLEENARRSFLAGEIREIRPGPDDSLIVELNGRREYYRARLFGPCLSNFYGAAPMRIDNGVAGGGLDLSTRIYFGDQVCNIRGFDRIADPSLPRPAAG